MGGHFFPKRILPAAAVAMTIKWLNLCSDRLLERSLLRAVRVAHRGRHHRHRPPYRQHESLHFDLEREMLRHRRILENNINDWNLDPLTAEEDQESVVLGQHWKTIVLILPPWKCPPEPWTKPKQCGLRWGSPRRHWWPLRGQQKNENSARVTLSLGKWSERGRFR